MIETCSMSRTEGDSQGFSVFAGEPESCTLAWRVSALVETAGSSRNYVDFL